MSTKTSVLELLEQNGGECLSGEEMAGMLGVSRAAVWKAIKTLKDDGHNITGTTNKGYSLTGSLLSEQGIMPYLNDKSIQLHVHDVLESTNITAKELALRGCGHLTAVIANSQTAGRGRMGRSFYSPPGSGLYMSIVVHSEKLKLPDVTLMTTAAAVAVCRAVELVFDKKPMIKWVNDVLLNGMKICGILTEAITNMEAGTIDWAVIGMGVNINTDDFPPEVRQVATSLLPGTEVSSSRHRNRLAAEIINVFASDGFWRNPAAILNEYKKRLAVLGETVTVIGKDSCYDALAVDIDNQGGLIVRLPDGTMRTLSSGEVSTKRIL